MTSPHKGQWRSVLMVSLICAWTNRWANNRDAGDVRRHRAHYDVTVMGCQHLHICSRRLLSLQIYTVLQICRCTSLSIENMYLHCIKQQIDPYFLELNDWNIHFYHTFYRRNCKHPHRCGLNIAVFRNNATLTSIVVKTYFSLRRPGYK